MPTNLDQSALGGNAVKLGIVVAVAFAAASFSGCLSDDGVGIQANPLASEEPASSVVVEPEEGVFVAENRGILRGSVLNDAGLAVPGARVLILDSDHFMETTREGSFQFENVTVGEKLVRAEADGYQAAENRTEVRAGNITNLTLYLLPLSDTGAGYRPHIHDYWGDKTELTIMDDDVDLRTQTKSRGGAGGTQTQQALSSVTYSAQNSSGNMYRIPLPGDGDPLALVFPGTKDIAITITWTQQAFTGYKVGISFRPPTTQPETFLQRQTSGSTWKIGVTPDMWDTGHQYYSLWAFYVYTFQDAAGDGTNFRPGIINGNFHVTVKITKGEILAEPAHPDFWANGDEIEINNHDNLGDCNNAYHTIDRDWPSCKITPKGLVPPGTMKLNIEMKWTYGTYEGTPPMDLVLIYRDATQNPWTTPVPEFKVAKCNGTGQTRTCEVTTKPGETDAYYQRRSTWVFTYAVKGYEHEDYDPEPRALKLSVRIVAIKDPAYGG
ncbi:MAG TPA: carboxypeptidase-like regulatory domain-containing protein, partial [Candidatus Thermoplasmatota archaeon]|nr:carboxypeptidase-like regulatory domain-containing protein [Candidatus Thermoplasmatota archaeon]